MNESRESKMEEQINKEELINYALMAFKDKVFDSLKIFLSYKGSEIETILALVSWCWIEKIYVIIFLTYDDVLQYFLIEIIY